MNLPLLELSFRLKKRNPKNKVCFILLLKNMSTNPIIFRLSNNSNKTWESNYFEKKTTESTLYNFKDLEIRKFVHRFFNYNGLTINKLKISYFNDVLHIFISYFSTLKTIHSIGKHSKIKIIKKWRTNNLKNYNQIKKNSKKYIKCIELNKYRKAKKMDKNYVLIKERQIMKLRRLTFLKYYKNCLSIQKHKTISNIKMHSFLNKFFTSLIHFTQNKFTISLTLNKLNTNIKKTITKNNIKDIKKNLTKLNNYAENKFFKEGVNILFIAILQKNSAKLVAQFISEQLKKLKRHNFFLKFIKTGLNIFNTKALSEIDGIKIKIKGRFNQAPRARQKKIEIGQKIPLLTIDSKIDYAQTVAFTQRGTFGVKVWIYEKKNCNV